MRRHLGSDKVEWQRGAAWAFQQAMGLVWYYERSNPSMSFLSRNTLSVCSTILTPELNVSDLRYCWTQRKNSDNEAARGSSAGSQPQPEEALHVHSTLHA